MRRFFTFVILVLLTLASIVFFVNRFETKNDAIDESKVVIVTTLFPIYDFSKALLKEKAEVVLLLPPGVESHSYDPSPRDMILIKNADLFVYTSDAMEPWVSSLTTLIPQERTIAASDGIVLQQFEQGQPEEDHAEDHDDDHDREGGDPHVWLDPIHAMVMVENIAQALVESHPELKDFVEANKAAYIEELTQLDQLIRRESDTISNKTIVFGGHYTFGYFAQRYGYQFVTPYRSLSPDAEPTPRSITKMISEIKQNDVGTIFYEELVEPRVASVIAEETGVKMLELSGIHNVSKKQLEEGITYIALMQRNISALKEGLK
ncbi:MAG: metal ABC transporter solute-binding protein, Zn/Mn family [Erysipelotrichaceae bacterium]